MTCHVTSCYLKRLFMVIKTSYTAENQFWKKSCLICSTHMKSCNKVSVLLGPAKGSNIDCIFGTF